MAAPARTCSGPRSSRRWPRTCAPPAPTTSSSPATSPISRCRRSSARRPRGCGRWRRRRAQPGAGQSRRAGAGRRGRGPGPLGRLDAQRTTAGRTSIASAMRGASSASTRHCRPRRCWPPAGSARSSSSGSSRCSRPKARPGGCASCCCIIRWPTARSAGARRSPIAARLRAVLRGAGAELVLHGHARDARLDALPGPRGRSRACACRRRRRCRIRAMKAARWHLAALPAPEADAGRGRVRQWSLSSGRSCDARYTLCLPGRGARWSRPGLSCSASESGGE